MSSIMDAQRAMILDTIKQTAPGEWKVMVMDEGARKLVDNVVKEDDILNANITHIEQMEQRRQMNQETDVIYILTPQPHIVDCLMADFERRRYRKAYILWTSKLPPQLRERVDRARNQIARLSVMNVDFYPRGSHLVTFRDPWSFPILYHPACNNLIRQHLAEIAEKIVALCVTLGEYPHIRYWRPPNPLPSHEAHVLCSLIARQVQDELDLWAQYHQDFPPPSSRPRGVLYITDRSMDLAAPFIHEFTYEAMAFDLLPIKDGDKITYRTIINEGQPDQEEKDVELTENDRLWAENRHRHMSQTIEKLMSDFQKFIASNPHFANKNAKNANSLNAIKDMMAGLPQFQTMKEAYSLHLSMAQECMNIFQRCRLPDLAAIEQTLATGFGEDHKKPKNIADEVVRTLDVEEITPSDRTRLLALYLLYRNGLLSSDLTRLRQHAQLSESDEEVIRNLELIGARVNKPLKDKIERQSLFQPKLPPPGTILPEEYGLSRFETNLKLMLEAHNTNTLDQGTFPYTKPHLEANQPDAAAQISSASLRSAKPTWAKTRGIGVSRESQQRIIVFMAGGATFSENRACYEVGEKASKEIFLVSSHMLTPALWMRQLCDLSADRRRLGLPADVPKPRAPNWVFEQERQPSPATGPPSGAMEATARENTAATSANRRLAGPSGGGGSVSLPSRPGGGMPSQTPPALPPQPVQMPVSEMGRINLNGDGKVQKEKKKHKLFGHSKK